MVHDSADGECVLQPGHERNRLSRGNFATPFFDADADDAANYGGIGAVIGHEIGHGFDDQGSKYDGDGNLVNWWTDTDRDEFGVRTKALIKQYDEFVPASSPISM